MEEETRLVGDPSEIDFSRDVDRPLSLQERLAGIRKDKAENRTYDIDIPGYDGELFGRYKLLDEHKIAQLVNTARKTTKDPVERGIAAASDVLINALIELWVRDEGREIRLAEVMGLENPVRFDLHLAEFLKFKDELGETPNARGVLRKLFIDNGLAIGAHSQRLQRWMTTNGVELSEEILGE